VRLIDRCQVNSAKTRAGIARPSPASSALVHEMTPGPCPGLRGSTQPLLELFAGFFDRPFAEAVMFIGVTPLLKGGVVQVAMQLVVLAQAHSAQQSDRALGRKKGRFFASAASRARVSRDRHYQRAHCGMRWPRDGRLQRKLNIAERVSPGRQGLQASATRCKLGFIIGDVCEQQRILRRHASRFGEEFDELLDAERFLIGRTRTVRRRETVCSVQIRSARLRMTACHDADKDAGDNRKCSEQSAGRAHGGFHFVTQRRFSPIRRTCIRGSDTGKVH
jgi:hypothetical protein